MAVGVGRQEAQLEGVVPRSAELAALAAFGRTLAGAAGLAEALEGIARAVREAVGATAVVARVADADGSLRARVVEAESAALAAELEGSCISAGEVTGEADETARLPAAVRDAAGKAGAEGILLLPVAATGRLVGTLELLRSHGTFPPDARLLARMAADHAAGAIRTFSRNGRDGSGAADRDTLELVGEALGAGGADSGTEVDVVRVAVQATGAAASLLWGRDERGGVRFIAGYGPAGSDAVERTLPFAEAALSATDPGRVERIPGAGTVATFPLGQPPRHVLQLVFRDGDASPDLPARLGTFAARAAQALRAGERARTLGVELARTRALLELVAEANEELSLAHTLQTAGDRVTDLLGTERIAIYLSEEGRLVTVEARSVTGAHELVAERLLELALGPHRGRGMLVLDDAASEPGLSDLDVELAECGIEAVVAVPLLVAGEVVGLLAVFLPAGRTLGRNERALVTALAAQLAVSVQNARLHEQATNLGSELEEVLELERQAARRLGSLYAISRSFTESLSLTETLDTVASTVVELLDLDAAVIRMRDPRGELLVPQVVRVSDVRATDALRTILSRPQPLAGIARRRLRTGRALVLDAETAAGLPAHRPLLPFLEKGATAVVLPISTSTELLGTLELVCLDPARPIGGEAREVAGAVTAQAALAIDNARLYQQHKELADAMQRSLLPHDAPSVAGIELGHVYASSARVDVGGDVYDFLELEDGRLAVVLGDVTGHGVDAAADMAKAKYVFRSLAREHPEPGEFLAAANDVVCGELASGKFITMLYLTVDPATGTVECASAGHPQPRLVLADGSVRPLEARGLALGIEPGQVYATVGEQLPAGATAVLYTDGVIEVRRDRELYGTERLDAVLARRRSLDARGLAEAVLENCREFGRGELTDDCAVVVIRRTAE